MRTSSYCIGGDGRRIRGIPRLLPLCGIRGAAARGTAAKPGTHHADRRQKLIGTHQPQGAHVHHGDHDGRYHAYADGLQPVHRISAEIGTDQCIHRIQQDNAHGRGGNGGRDGLAVRTCQTHAVDSIAEPAAQHPQQQREAQDVAHGHGSAQRGDPVLRRQQERGRNHGDYLHTGGGECEHEGMLAILEREEGALNNQIRRGHRQADAQTHQRPRNQQRLVHAHRRQQRQGDRRGNHRKRGREEEHQHTDIAQRRTELPACVVEIMVGQCAGDLREHRGRHRHGDQRVRQHEQGIGVLVGGVARHVELAEPQPHLGGLRGVGGDAGVDDIGQLVDDHHADAPRGDRSHRTQAYAPQPPARTVADADASHRHEQDQRLERHTCGPGTRGQRQLIGGPELNRLLVGPAEQQDEHREPDAADHVGAHGTPRIGAEMVLGRQNLADDGVQPVEEDLRHAPQREGVGQGGQLRAAVHVQRRQQRCGRGHEGRDRQQKGDGHGDELVEPFLGVLAVQRAHDLGHQHGVEDAAGDQREHDLRNHGAGLIGVGRHAGGAHRRGEQDGADLPGHARGRGAGGHDQ